MNGELLAIVEVRSWGGPKSGKRGGWDHGTFRIDYGQASRTPKRRGGTAT